MNLCAISNVRNHLYVKMSDCKKAEEKAQKENMSEECINMHHDMYLLYLGLLVELDNVIKTHQDERKESHEILGK